MSGECCESGVVGDCDVCDGNNADKDDCGVCNGNNDTCTLDCANVKDGPGVVIPVSGECCATGAVDDCDVCDGNNADKDDCGVCNGNNDCDFASLTMLKDWCSKSVQNCSKCKGKDKNGACK